MTARIRRWTYRRSRRRVASFWEIVNGRGVIGIWYGDEATVKVATAGPQLLGSLKHLIAILRLFEPQLRASAKAKLDEARALVAELNGSN